MSRLELVRIPGERRQETITYYRPPWPVEVLGRHRGDIVLIDGERWEIVGYFTRLRRPDETIEEFDELVLDVHLIEPPLDSEDFSQLQ